MHYAGISTAILEVVEGGKTREGEVEGEEEGKRFREFLQVPLTDFYGREGGREGEREGGKVKKEKG